MYVVCITVVVVVVVSRAFLVFFRIISHEFFVEWKYLAVNPQTKATLDRLTAVGGKFSGYRKNELVQIALDVLEKV